MSNSLSLSEIFLLAENIEKQGREFYLGAAAKTDDPVVKEVMSFLAEEETRHEKIFADLRKKFFGSDDVYFDEDHEDTAKYITGLVDSHVFNVSKDAAELLGSIQTPRSAVEMAINFENDTIKCFTAFKGIAKDETKLIDRLIEEEHKHKEKLEKVLEQL